MHNGIYIKVTIKKQRKIEKINTYARWFLCKFCNFPTNRAKSSETVEKKKSSTSIFCGKCASLPS